MESVSCGPSAGDLAEIIFSGRWEEIRSDLRFRRGLARSMTGAAGWFRAARPAVALAGRVARLVLVVPLMTYLPLSRFADERAGIGWEVEPSG
jgi:hypothetical protein